MRPSNRVSVSFAVGLMMAFVAWMLFSNNDIHDNVDGATRKKRGSGTTFTYWAKEEDLVNQENCRGPYCHLANKEFYTKPPACIVCQSVEVCLEHDDCCPPCRCDQFDHFCRVKDSSNQI
ncbi:uncharacterized protein LOC142342372 [Convolutriloba macropyga]|uniref:uncharacterized protein LOC142342372 n=1 Tax=Convolutriloba macropyga TaxID=536237 RepID=UPI003F526CD8